MCIILTIEGGMSKLKYYCHIIIGSNGKKKEIKRKCKRTKERR
jgi:hypothetical protein